MENVTYISTRGASKELLASEAILKGISDDGGLFVPKNMPKLDVALKDLIHLDYRELAFKILKLYLTDFSDDELKQCINSAYDEKFDTDIIAPLVNKENYFFLELFHGKTLAFKDMALSLLPHLLKTAAKKNKIEKEIVILTATSGDTGKAALEGFTDVDGTKIIVFYPEGGVSQVQKMQMVTQEGENTFVSAIKGNFDDAQTAVKHIFNDKDFNDMLAKDGFMLSSANSINIGRLVPQIVYYFYAYAQMVQNNYITLGEEINFTVPTGNFGNILAGYYAKQMGLPIKALICASNDNKVLYDFFQNGVYNRNRAFILTISPSMDILISSNLERLLYHVTNADHTKQFMSALSETGEYSLNKRMEGFYGEFATEAETMDAVKEIYENHGYICDTHTAVACASYKKYVNHTNDETKNVIISTASPYKFPKDVLRAIDKKYENENDFKCIGILSELMNANIPSQIDNIENKKILHESVCKKEEISNYIKRSLL